MNLSIRKLVWGTMAAVTLLAIPLSADAGGGFGGGRGFGGGGGRGWGGGGSRGFGGGGGSGRSSFGYTAGKYNGGFKTFGGGFGGGRSTFGGRGWGVRPRWNGGYGRGTGSYVAGGSYYGTEGTMQVEETAPQFSGGEIKILASADLSDAVNYQLNDQEFSMQPSYSQTFTEDRTWVVRFYEGGENSQLKEYTLTSGTYQFVVVDGKVDLQTVAQ